MPAPPDREERIQVAWRVPVSVHRRLLQMQRERQDDAILQGKPPSTVSLNALITELLTQSPEYKKELRSERDNRLTAERHAQLAAAQRAARAAQRPEHEPQKG